MRLAGYNAAPFSLPWVRLRAVQRFVVDFRIDTGSPSGLSPTNQPDALSKTGINRLLPTKDQVSEIRVIDGGLHRSTGRDEPIAGERDYAITSRRSVLSDLVECVGDRYGTDDGGERASRPSRPTKHVRGHFRYRRCGGGHRHRSKSTRLNSSHI